jgi:hypothetical protein
MQDTSPPYESPEIRAAKALRAAKEEIAKGVPLSDPKGVRWAMDVLSPDPAAIDPDLIKAVRDFKIPDQSADIEALAMAKLSPQQRALISKSGVSAVGFLRALQGNLAASAKAKGQI